MKRRPASRTEMGPVDDGRRTFLKGLALGSAMAGLGFRIQPSWAGGNAVEGNSILHGPVFHLSIDRAAVNFTGGAATATAVNGSVPGPVLHWREGEQVTIHVTNRLTVPASIHWHGIVVPTRMDGVPGISFPGISPGATFTYQFEVRQSGTFWYHSHTRFQEQSGLYGALVITPRANDPFQADRDYVVMLSDWTDEDPEDVFYHLKTMGSYYNYRRRTIADFFRDASARGLAATLKDRWAWGTMRMDPRDISDVSGRLTGGTYTYLVNGLPPIANWTGLFRRGERVRLRFINGSAMTYFDVRIPGLKMTVVAADGCNVEPVSVDEFRIAVAETYDVIVEPRDDAYTIFAQAMDRSGFARATIAISTGLSAAVPAMDPIFSRTMADMGMADMSMAGMEMHGMDMTHMNHPAGSGTPPAIAMTQRMAKGLPNAHGVSAYPQPKDVHLRPGPAVVNIAANPTERLDRPGDGLNDNGRRVLTYADLVRLDAGPQNLPFVEQDPDAEVLLHLTGNMERYVFGFNGMTYEQGEPVRFPYGQRVWVTLINDTMMEHPIHLHGMFTELDNHRGRLRPLKHTVNVKPGEKLHYYVNATEPGRWAYHCHLLYHMEAGMFTTAVVA